MKKQSLICEPADGEVNKARARKLNGETLETKPIVDILLSRNGGKREYLVRVEDGTSHRMKKVGQNPQFLLFYNDEPLATCGNNYVPLFNQEIESCVMKALDSIGKNPLRIDYTDFNFYRSAMYHKSKDERNYNWRMTAVLEKDFEVPLGHLKQSDKFDWGVGITNSYDLSEGIHVYMYLYRQICSNGLYAWSVSGQRNFVHVEKELDHELILNKITDGVASIVKEHGTFFTRLDEMSRVTPTRAQAKLLATRLGVRKYEAALLADRGMIIEYDKSEIRDVALDNRINSEYDLLNALTSMSQETNSMKRQLELQTGLAEKILQARTVVPSL